MTAQQILQYFLDHPETALSALAIMGGVIFPALSQIAKLFGEGPKATAASKFFDGLGLDLGKALRALRSLKPPTSDEVAKAINDENPPKDGVLEDER